MLHLSAFNRMVIIFFSVLQIGMGLGCTNKLADRTGSSSVDGNATDDCKPELARLDTLIPEAIADLKNLCDDNLQGVQHNGYLVDSLDRAIERLSIEDISSSERRKFERSFISISEEFVALSEKHRNICTYRFVNLTDDHYRIHFSPLLNCADSLAFSRNILDSLEDKITRAWELKKDLTAASAISEEQYFDLKTFLSEREVLPADNIEEEIRARVPEYAAGFERVMHRGHSYDQFIVDKELIGKMQLFWRDDDARPFENIGRLKRYVERSRYTLHFAVNGGMYQPNTTPEGLFVNNGEEFVAVNTTPEIPGKFLNFYLQPNGIFLIDRNNQPAVITTEAYSRYKRKVRLATQSGPMLVINGQMHDKFNEGSSNKFIRNGVGVMKDGRVIFAISNERVNFFDFARFFMDRGCENALYLDGAISKMHFPDEREDLDGFLGPIIAIVEPNGE